MGVHGAVGRGGRERGRERGRLRRCSQAGVQQPGAQHVRVTPAYADRPVTRRPHSPLPQDLAAGTIAGTAQLLVGHPFDTIKVGFSSAGCAAGARPSQRRSGMRDPASRHLEVRRPGGRPGCATPLAQAGAPPAGQAAEPVHQRAGHLRIQGPRGRRQAGAPPRPAQRPGAAPASRRPDGSPAGSPTRLACRLPAFVPCRPCRRRASGGSTKEWARLLRLWRSSTQCSSRPGARCSCCCSTRTVGAPCAAAAARRGGREARQPRGQGSAPLARPFGTGIHVVVWPWPALQARR
jgi:hypothetical protein